MNTGKRRVNQIRRRTELVHLHTANTHFKGDTSVVGAVLDLMYKKLDIGTSLKKFIDRLKGYAERKFENSKNVLGVVTEMEDRMEIFEENNILEDLY